MTTDQRADQRSGFRLPWGANRAAAAAEPELGNDDEARDAGHGDGLARIGSDGWDTTGSEPMAQGATGITAGPDAEDHEGPEPWGGWPGRNAGFDGRPNAPRPEDGRFPGMTAEGVTPDVAARAQAEGAAPVHDVEWPAEDVARLRAIAAAAVEEPATAEAGADAPEPAAHAADAMPPVDLARIFGDRVAARAAAAEAGEPAGPAPADPPAADHVTADALEAPVAALAASAPDADDALATDARVAAEPVAEPAARSSGRSDREARRVPAPVTAPATPVAPVAAAPAGLASKFMADLSRAMQAAAQAARDEALARLAAEAGARIDAIGAQASTGSAEVKRAAEDDIAATREWSKAEMARIKDETDRRIADRKARLDGELADHAASIRRRTDTVREALAGYEAELGRFIEQVLAEEDPTRIATLAQRLPEPPALDVAEASSMAEAIRAAEPERAAATPSPARATSARQPAPSASVATDPAATEAALAEARALADAEAEAAALAEAEAQQGMTAESAAAAEAEALAGLDGGSDAWFASQGAEKGRGKGSASIVRSELIVTGLASVAGIAGFKRELSAVEGVRHVGVSAGHAGEFVFAVGHAATMDLAGVLPTLKDFAPHVTGKRDGALLVAATEPAATE